MHERISIAPSAHRHRVSDARIRHVIRRCGLRFYDGEMILFLGDDADGNALEVGGFENDDASAVRVVHAMRLRARYRTDYLEALLWRNPSA